MKILIRHLLPVMAIALGLALLPSSLHATEYTAAATGSWSNSNNWSPAGVPGASDDAEIASGITITIASTPANINNLMVDSGGTIQSTINGTCLNVNGSVTNNGTYSFGKAGQSVLINYNGTANYFAGSGVISNQVANFASGASYTILPGVVFFTGANNQGSSKIQGSGTLSNQGSIWYNTTVAPSITTLDSSAVGSTFSWTNVNTTLTPKACAYYNLIVGNQGSSGANLNGAGLSIAGNFTDMESSPVSSWPANNAIGGILNYLSTSGTVAGAFPVAFSIGGLNQTGGKLLMPANGVLTVTGSGAVWTQTGGSFAQPTSSTVAFTGTNPIINGAFANVVIGSTATDAVAPTSFTATNSLTVAAGGSLDLSGLGGYTLTTSESVTNSGTIIGGITANANSKAKIYTETTPGTYATATFNGALSLAATNTVNLNVNSTAGGSNDKVTVSGALTLNNTTFNLSAPGAGATIDTADYTLVTAAGGISGTPVLNWVVAPANVGDYTLVTTGTTITLHDVNSVVTPQPALSVADNAGTLTLSWDTNTYPGFSLQAETNATGPNGGSWGIISSPDASPVTITADPNNPAVFFRLVN